MKRVNWILVAGLVVVVFAAMLVLFGNLVLAAIGGAVAALAGIFLFPASRPRLKLPADLDPATVGKDLEAAGFKIRQIKALAGRISKIEAQKDARRVVDLMGRILDDLYKDPSDIRRARTFLAYHIDATLNVFNRYVELSSQNLRDPGLLDSLRRTEQTFNTMAMAYERLLAGLLENEVMDLDVEIKTLEGAFRSEGVEFDSSFVKKQEA